MTVKNIFFDFKLFILLFKNKTLKSGSIIAIYLILYSVVRFFIEGIRIDSVLNIGALPIAQIFSIILFATGLIFLFLINKKRV